LAFNNADLLLDTSAAIALVTPTHEAHETVFERVHTVRLGLAGHAAFETYSVLTRQPLPLRLSAANAGQLIAHNFPASVSLSGAAAGRLLAELTASGIVGGAVFDALVGAAARHANVLLISRDRRAAETYRSLGVTHELL
jgi:predicted nucleic acid-binding protein